jgi:hypothetical protein
VRTEEDTKNFKSRRTKVVTNVMKQLSGGDHIRFSITHFSFHPILQEPGASGGSMSRIKCFKCLLLHVLNIFLICFMITDGILF